MKVGIVLVHFRYWPDVLRALAALDGQARPADALVVVDDRSGDGSVEALRAERPEIEVLVAPHNRGVVANFNAGAATMLARGVDALLLMTHETHLEPDALARLAQHLEREPRVGAVAPLLGFLSSPQTVFSAGGELVGPTWQNPHTGMYDPVDAWRGRGARAVPWVDGACVLLRASALREVGPLPERYFHYYDDVEFGVRLNRAGWEVRCLCDAVARQEPGLLPEYYRVRNRLGFLFENAPRRVLARAIAAHIVQAAHDARAGAACRPLAVAQLRGIRDFALGRWGPAPARRTVARRRDYATGGALHAPARRSWSMPAAAAAGGGGGRQGACLPP